MQTTSTRTTNPSQPRCTGAAHLPLWHEAFFGLDWLALRLSPIFSGAGIPRGDGSPIIIVPGLFASDASLVEMYDWLARVGYRPYVSGIGLNARCPETSINMLLETIDRAVADTGRRVRIIGHSLGGLLARGAALRRPGKVAHVITLGSPVHGVAAHPAVLALAELVRADCSGDCLPALQRPLPPTVAEACIYSKDDGVVDWRTCTRDGATNVEVSGTHLGLVFNPQVFRSLGELLADKSARRGEAHARRQPLAVVQSVIARPSNESVQVRAA